MNAARPLSGGAAGSVTVPSAASTPPHHPPRRPGYKKNGYGTGRTRVSRPSAGRGLDQSGPVQPPGNRVALLSLFSGPASNLRAQPLLEFHRVLRSVHADCRVFRDIARNFITVLQDAELLQPFNLFQP